MGSENAELSFAEAFLGRSGKSIFPGGFNRSSYAIAPRTKMLVSGSGYEVVDEDGRRLIDLNNNFTSLIHGNAHPEVVEAAIETARKGTSFGMPTFPEFEHATAMLERIPYMEQIRYMNSGTECVMTALRIARAATGRDVVVFVQNSYHGSSDPAALTGPSRDGIPEGVRKDVVTLPINRTDALAEVFAERGGQIATLVLDTMPNRAGLVPLEDEYLRTARELTTKHGALLISDEVISLRQSYHGSMVSRGVTPDMMTIAKIIGGGFPVGAVLGSVEVMAVLDPRRPGGFDHGGTLTGNPVTMRAGMKAMELFDEPAIERLNGLGDLFRSRLRETASRYGWDVRGAGSLSRLMPSDGAELPADAGKRLWFAAWARDVALTQNNLISLSTPMTEAVIEDVVARIGDAMAGVANGEPTPPLN